jgi:hypothetical protein
MGMDSQISSLSFQILSKSIWICNTKENFGVFVYAFTLKLFKILLQSILTEANKRKEQLNSLNKSMEDQTTSADMSDKRKFLLVVNHIIFYLKIEFIY